MTKIILFMKKAQRRAFFIVTAGVVLFSSNAFANISLQSSLENSLYNLSVTFTFDKKVDFKLLIDHLKKFEFEKGILSSRSRVENLNLVIDHKRNSVRYQKIIYKYILNGMIKFKSIYGCVEIRNKKYWNHACGLDKRTPAGFLGHRSFSSRFNCQQNKIKTKCKFSVNSKITNFKIFNIELLSARKLALSNFNSQVRNILSSIEGFTRADNANVISKVDSFVNKQNLIFVDSQDYQNSKFQFIYP